MIKILSLKLTKKEIFYALLIKNDDEIKLEKDEKFSIPQNKTLPQLMHFFKDTFNNLLNVQDIEKVVYWCEPQGKFISIMPLGVLNLCCDEQKIDTEPKYSANITAKKLGIDSKERGNTALKNIDNFFPGCKYKNQEMRKVLSIGTIVLRGIR